VLLVYKKSTYQIYQERKNPIFLRDLSPALRPDRERFKKAHESHYRALDEVTRALRASGVAYRVVYRARACDYSPYDGVISVGGDGTFLEAARRVRNQWILGVNSDPDRSVGNFCRATAGTFRGLFDRILRGRAGTRRLNRLQAQLNGRSADALNEILVSHQVPAAMTRYRIEVNGYKEEHWNSGLWISTAAGSTGAIRSAGGRRLPLGSGAIQYLPREPYRRPEVTYRLTGGLLPAGAAISLSSMMREGMLYVDGQHFKIPFAYGQVLRV
jgi:NAD+ kinase